MIIKLNIDSVDYTCTPTVPVKGASMIIKLNIDGTDYTVTPVVVPPPPPPPPTSGLVLLPAGVTPNIINLDALTTWVGEHDAATSGTATGSTSYPVTIAGKISRSFTSTYTSHGGFRYHVNYGVDTVSTHFIYAGDLYIEDPTQIAQMELDNNQVTADGKTYIFGVQANANDGMWDITKQDTQCHWVATKVPGNPKTWPAKTWMHFEIMSHRDNSGNITYDAIHFNGKTTQINTTLPSARNIGWGIGHMLVNWQLGGASSGSGSIHTYGSNIVVAKW